MAKKRDLTGHKFGKLTVLYEGEPHITSGGRSRITWVVRCECGKEKTVVSADLTSGGVKSCGCLKTFEMIGRRFGRLTVIGRAKDYWSPGGKVQRRWRCSCSCGRTTEANTGSLTCGNVRSCGCYCIERTKEVHTGSGINISGRRVGMLTVMHDTGKRKNNQQIWLCKCDCGVEVEVGKNQLLQGKTTSCDCKRYRRGADHPNYDHSVTMEERELKKRRKLLPGYKHWNIGVKELASYTCRACGSVGGNLCSHHIKSFARFRDLRLDLSNGACLCKDCHDEFHVKYGNINFTSDDYYVFLAQKAFEIARLEDAA